MKEEYVIIVKLGIQTFMAGNLVRLRAEFYKNHALIDADALPTISLKVGSGAFVTPVDTTKVEDTEGVYEYIYQIPVDAVTGSIRYRFQGLIGTKIVSAEDVFTVTARTA